MEKKITDEMIVKQINKNSDEAKRLLDDQDKMERFLERIEQKLKKIPAVGDKLSNVPILISLVKSYVRKEYQEVPLGSIIAIVGGLIYFLSPIDLIPDHIPGIGYLDDATVIVFLLKMVGDDVEEYKEWQVKEGKRSMVD